MIAENGFYVFICTNDLSLSQRIPVSSLEEEENDLKWLISKVEAKLPDLRIYISKGEFCSTPARYEKSPISYIYIYIENIYNIFEYKSKDPRRRRAYNKCDENRQNRRPKSKTGR